MMSRSRVRLSSVRETVCPRNPDMSSSARRHSGRSHAFSGPLLPIRFPTSELGSRTQPSALRPLGNSDPYPLLVSQEVPPNPPVATIAHPVTTLRTVLATPRD